MSRARRAERDHEHCELCRLAAPRWSVRGYRRWQLLVAPSGEILGAICPGCAADPELLLELIAPA